MYQFRFKVAYQSIKLFFKVDNSATPEETHPKNKTDENNLNGTLNAMAPSDGELVMLDWKTPKEYLEASIAQNLHLYPPQFYQMTQMSKFYCWRKLQDYVLQITNNLGCDTIVPITPIFNKGLGPDSAVMTLPGDNRYGLVLNREIDLVNKGDASKPIHRIYLTLSNAVFNNIDIVENLGYIPKTSLSSSKL
ncbi:hypothetical protein BB561_001716 [Smittium simulii]|uniref:Uncharacterized protein n=1 Tax=Smittium simulii TaxID=133385 RepID=A0A2T9YTA5_9FUNG|nr:hypothetical protein BB561_001716 [Smittium simulii]